jgi:microcystin-dependent protein
VKNLSRFLLILFAVMLPPGAAAFAQTATPTPTATPHHGTFMPIGAVQAFAGVPPAGWLLCSGAQVSRTTYAALFGVISTTYGAGDGSTTFNLPDLRGRAIIGTGTGTGLTPRTLADTLGNETHTITVTELPSHNHGVTDPGHTHGPPAGGSTFYWTVGTGTGAVGGGTASKAVANTGSATTGITTNNTGGGAAMGIMQPSIALYYYIWSGDRDMATAVPIVAEETIVITVVVVFPTHTATPTPTPTYTPTPGDTPTPTPTASPTVSTGVAYSVGSQAVMFDYTVRPGDAMSTGLLVIIACILIVLSYLYFKRGG